MKAVLWIVLALAAAAFAIDPIGPTRAAFIPLKPLAAPAEDARDDFREDGVFPSAARPPELKGIPVHGSWIGSDRFQGDYVSRPFRARRSVTMMIAGYPVHAGIRLALDVRLRDGSRRTLVYDGANPQEHWAAWRAELPAQAVDFKVIASDHSAAPAGWLAVSDPLASAAETTESLLGLARIAATTCLALALLFGPGLLWMSERARSPGDLASAMVAGPACLVLLGLATWAGGGILPPAAIARAGVGLVLAFVVWRFLRIGGRLALPPHAGRIAAASALLSGLAVAKATYSGGPDGELYGGAISRTLEASGHPDSRISFHVVQVVANHLAPFGPVAAGYFAPWSFASRGPLAGLAASPIVLATGGRPPRGMPNDAWQPFDPQGFATYRIAMIVLASLLGWAVFGTMAALCSAEWGRVAATAAMLAPFFVHELYFTWPKLPAAAFVLLAFDQARRGRPMRSGFALAAGYLFHPLAALAAPFIGLWIVSRRAETQDGTRSGTLDGTRGGTWGGGGDGFDWGRTLRSGALFVLAAGICVLPWQFLGHFSHAREGAQTHFLTYFRLADNADATWDSWWRSRWDNLSNTFIPLHLLWVDPAHESLHSLYGPADPWERAAFLPWNTLPFALGIPGFVLIAAGIARAAARSPASVAAAFVGPALLLTVYWGAASTGFMRHCGHALFASTVVLGIWGWTSPGAPPQRSRAVRLFMHPACVCWRLAEVACLAFGATLFHSPPDAFSSLAVSDLACLAAAGACLVGAGWTLSRGFGAGAGGG